jgi:predicted ABC-type exoprotein transport system permease subunit
MNTFAKLIDFATECMITALVWASILILVVLPILAPMIHAYQTGEGEWIIISVILFVVYSSLWLEMNEDEA